MTDYFRLLSVECSPELRRRLDGGMHLAPHPVPEAYAQISPRYDGKCPLHLPDGRCALHAELGGDVLAAVCQLYPRGVRNGENRECSCANSCEAVLEMLLHRAEPLRFIRMRLQFRLPDAPPRRHFFHTAGREQEIRLWFIAQLQNRTYPLPARMQLLGRALQAMDGALAAKDDARAVRLLSGEESLPVPETAEAGYAQLQAGLDIAERMLEIIDEHSTSVHDYGAAALAYFGRGEEAFARYEAAAARFADMLPDWECWFEHMLVNHMYFVQFPFQDRPVPLKTEYLSRCAVYVLLRFLCVGWMAEHTRESEAVDVAAAAFRLVDHTSFDLYAGPLLEQLGCSGWEQLQELLCL